jgi:orotidine-5'-phosphate decarboxylase
MGAWRIRELVATEHPRPAHPATAIRAGATHIVVGRSATRAPDPAAVLADLRNELGCLAKCG